MVRPLPVLAALLLVVGTPELGAHPLHTSYTEMARDRSGRLTIAIKVFSDDFHGALAPFARKEGMQPNGDETIIRYVKHAFLVLTPDGRPIALSWCGFKAEGGQLTVCAMTTSSVRGVVRVSNSLLLERFTDQINIVRWTTSSGSRTVVLTQRRKEADLQ
jgi:hypothetical protein